MRFPAATPQQDMSPASGAQKLARSESEERRISVFSFLFIHHQYDKSTLIGSGLAPIAVQSAVLYSIAVAMLPGLNTLYHHTRGLRPGLSSAARRAGSKLAAGNFPNVQFLSRRRRRRMQFQNLKSVGAHSARQIPIFHGPRVVPFALALL